MFAIPGNREPPLELSIGLTLMRPGHEHKRERWTGKGDGEEGECEKPNCDFVEPPPPTILFKIDHFQNQELACIPTLLLLPPPTPHSMVSLYERTPRRFTSSAWSSPRPSQLIASNNCYVLCHLHHDMHDRSENLPQREYPFVHESVQSFRPNIKIYLPTKKQHVGEINKFH